MKTYLVQMNDNGTTLYFQSAFKLPWGGGSWSVELTEDRTKAGRLNKHDADQAWRIMVQKYPGKIDCQIIEAA